MYLFIHVLTNNNSKNSRLTDIFVIFPLVFCIIVVRLTWLKKRIKGKQRKIKFPSFFPVIVCKQFFILYRALINTWEFIVCWLVLLFFEREKFCVICLNVYVCLCWCSLLFSSIQFNWTKLNWVELLVVGCISMVWQVSCFIDFVTYTTYNTHT